MNYILIFSNFLYITWAQRQDALPYQTRISSKFHFYEFFCHLVLLKVDFNACQSRNIDEGFDRAKMIMERLPYNVKHFLSLGFIRWFLFHLFCHTYTVWLASQKYFCSLWEFQKLFRLLCILDSSWVLLKLLCDTKMCCMLILVSKLYTVMQTELLHLFSSVSLIASHAFHLWINTMYHLLQVYLFLHRNQNGLRLTI